MKRSKDSYNRRAEIEELYRSYCSGLTNLPAYGLLKFLHKEQMELTADEEMVVSLIGKYEINETAKESQSMTFEGFFRYMESKDCSVFDLTHSKVYQDMDQPLNNYFISSSHNTYLTGDQLVGKSDLDAYASALRKGCRCLEIDCWDGPDLEPIVYHGYTLTSKILFKDVITTIEKHAFEVSAYPVILSLENHCCQEQQEVMARYLISILGDKLLTAPLDHMTAEELPSPNMLQYKILIKNKKLKPQKEGEDEDEDEEDEEDEDEEDEDEEDEEDEDEDEHKMELVEEEEEAKGKEARGPKRRFRPPKKVKKRKKVKVKVAQLLSDLVVYTRSVKFISFSHSKENQKYFENTSMAEKKAHKLAKNSGADFVKHNQRFISRIYPRGARVVSSNYNPQEFWNVGAQLVALNFQSTGTPMDLNDGRFQDNGGCGYALKPTILMSSRAFDPGCGQSSFKSIHLHLKVAGGANLPAPKMKPQEAYVRVEICGIPADSTKNSTKTVKNNFLNPQWDADMNFTIKVPKLCLLRFCVRNQTGLTSEFVAQYTLPFTSLKKGYRWVPLRNRDGSSLDPASLYVHVWY